MKNSIKVMTVLGVGFMAMASYDYFIATYASESGGLFGGFLWKIRQMFGPSASALALLGVSAVCFFVAVIEAREEN